MPGVHVTTPIEPARAAVVPRGSVVGAGGEILPLETHIRALAPRRPLIALLGPGGSGKSTAIAHLAHVLADLPIECCDGLTDVFDLISRDRVVVAAFDELPTVVTFDAVLEIAPWGESERIDYLLAKHPAQVRSVMERLRACEWIDALDGSPRMWTTVLQRMAEVPSLTNVPAMLRQVMNVVLAMFGEDAARTRDIMASAARSNLRDPLGVPAFLQHPFMLRLALVEELTESIDEVPASHWWQSLREPRLQRDSRLVDLVASRLKELAGGAERLQNRIECSSHMSSADVTAQAPMVTVMLAIDRTFRPKSNVINLEHVRAADVDWSGSNLPKLCLAGATLARANLQGINWPGAIATRVDFRRANLTVANLSDARLAGALLDEASLAGANLTNADLQDVSAVMANFNGTRLGSAELRQTDLRGASFVGATLHRAILIDVQLAAADFSGANLNHSMCLGCDFRDSIWTSAILDGATLDGSTLAGMTISGLSATDARFAKTDLTGLRLRGAQLKGSLFRQAGLADIDWEGADLRDCDFTHAAFHMGTSRSGLVFSPVACEGSRTGFYTHDDLEPYKLPEEIRAANLCGANLIGARVTGTDWYLVDLRGAKYTTHQAEWFRKCGAILFDRRA
jgi:uncharacterized protein YjbI with pentapeptide repeats